MMKQRSITDHLRRWWLRGFLIIIVFCSVFAGWFLTKPPTPPEIATAHLPRAAEGTITSFTGQSKPTLLTALRAAPKETITFESSPLTVHTKANAAVLTWVQDREEGITTEIRTFNGTGWSTWAETEPLDGGKDGTKPAGASSLILARTIAKIQYRFTLKGSETAPSATIDTTRSTIDTIDSSAGPDGSKSPISRLTDSLLFKKASAVAEGPRVLSRAEWGCPEPNGSPGWQPEYQSLGRAIVHHTATTESPNAFMAIRAIWQYHTYNLGWGDIGYNYIVDSAGNIFQGRYFDHAYAKAHNADVIGGHAYGNNQGTTGIAAIGDLDKISPTDVQVASISNIIGFKMAPYGFNPAGDSPFGAVVVGHRDVYPTACPGRYLYPRLDNIKQMAAGYYLAYDAKNKLDYSFVNQRLLKDNTPIAPHTTLKPSDDIKLSIDLRNEGTEPWRNDTQYRTVLGTSSPADRASVFYDPSSWIYPSRPASFSERVNPSTGDSLTANQVDPGEVARFTFTLKIPDLVTSSDQLASQLFAEYFRPVQDGRIWFPRDIGLHYPLSVEVHSYKWQYVSQNLYTDATKSTAVNPAALNSNTRYFATLRLKNIGTASWHQGLFRLGTDQPSNRNSAVYDTSWLYQSRPATLVENSIAQGETGTIEFWIKTPNTTTFSHKEYFKPLQEGVVWLNDVGLYWEFRRP